MRREQKWLLLPFMAWVGACADTVTSAPPDGAVTNDVPVVDAPSSDVSADVSTSDVTAVDAGNDVGPDASVDDVVTVDDVTDDAVAPPDVIVEDVVLPDVIVEDITLLDVPVTPDVPATDVPVTPDVPVTDVPVTPDVPVTDVPVADAGPPCTNGIADTCPAPGAASRCADLNDGRAHTVVFSGLTSGIPATCEGTQTGMARDGVVPLTLTATSDVVITAMPTGGDLDVLSLFRPGGCGVSTQELRCVNPSAMGGGGAGSTATLRATSLPAGTYYVQVAALGGSPAILQAMVTPARPRMAGDVCPGVTVTPDGGPVTLATTGFQADADWGTSCGGSNTGNVDSVFTFTTTAVRDVSIEVSATGGGNVSAELNTTCGARPAATDGCATGNPSRRTYRSLPAGTYYVTATSGAAGRTIIASVTTATPTPTSAADRCPGVTLAQGVGATAEVAALPTRIATLACVPSSTADAAFSFVAPPAGNDVIVRVAHSGTSNVGMQLQQPCGGMNVGTCVGPGMGRTGSSYWQRYQGLTPASVYSIVAATSGTSGSIGASWTSIPTQSPVTVMGTPTCMSPRVIPAAGGIFRGNNSASMLRTSAFGAGTLNASCLTAGCMGGRTVVYQLTLTARRHVIATLSGGFDTFLWINSGASCPGNGVMNACNDDRIGTNSQLDVTLDAGNYWVFAAGCGLGAAGDYTLDVVTLAP